MSFIKCYDIVEQVINVVTERYSGQIVEDSQKKSVIKKYCDEIQRISDEFDGVSYSVDVDEKSMDIEISLVCEDMESNKNDVEFVDMVKNSKEINVSYYDDDHYKIKFVFEGIWNWGI